jgi:hypothetical protein
MTKVQATFDLTRPLDDAALDAISKATSIYGIHYVKISPSADRVTVEYDATRLKREHVPAALIRTGIPVQNGN